MVCAAPTERSLLESDSVFEIQCECCGAKIHVDPKTRSIFFTEKEGHKSRSFQDVIKDVTGAPQRAEEKFRLGLEKEKNRDDELDTLFKEAKKRAAENPEEKPPSIWDLE